MSYQTRNDYNTSFFHVMSHGINDEYIFEKDVYKDFYLYLVNKELKQFEGIHILSFCVMSNHTHFLFYTNSIKKLSKYIQIVNSKYAKFYNENELRRGYVFRERFKSQPIFSEKYLFQCINYIHNNPVKAKMVNECNEYKYSSFNDYMGGIGISNSKIIKEIMGDRNFDNDFLKKYDDNYFNESISTSALYVNCVVDRYIEKFGITKEQISGDDKLMNELITELYKKRFVKKKDISEILNVSYWKLKNLKK